MTSAFIMTFDQIEGDPAEAYDAVQEDMDLGGTVPDGAVRHYAGPYEGGWRVVDVWEDEEKFQRFAQEKIGPITAKHGIGEPKVERVELRNVEDGPASDPTLVQIVRLPLDAETFDSLDAKVRPAGVSPDGLVHHVNGVDADGHVVVVDSWASREARDSFIQSQVVPNVPGDAAPQIEDLEIHNTLS